MIFEDFSSAHLAVLLSVLGIAFVMGAVVNKSNFCTMGAVSDLVNMGDSGRIRAGALPLLSLLSALLLLRPVALPVLILHCRHIEAATLHGLSIFLAA